jgi:PAS domain S-box-containing protein
MTIEKTITWRVILADRLTELSNSVDPIGAVNSLLIEFAKFIAADYCAIVTSAQRGLLVIADSDPLRRSVIDQFSLGSIWGHSLSETEQYPQIFQAAEGFYAHVIERVGAHNLPLAIVIQANWDVDDALERMITSTGGLIKLAYAHLVEVQRRRSLPKLQTIFEKADQPEEAEQNHDAVYLQNAIEKLTAAQTLSVQLVNEIISVPNSLLDQTIQAALARMGDFCGSDRTYLFQEVSDDLISNTHEWCADGIEPAIHLLQGQPREIARPWYDFFEVSSHIYISDVSSLPESDEIGQILAMQGIQSLLAVPLRVNGRIFGFVGYDAVRQKRSFMKGEITLISFVANVIAAALVQRDVERRLFQIRLEQDRQRQRLAATLNVIPDIVLELDADLRIVSYHANPMIPRQIDLKSLIGLKATTDLAEDVCAVAQQVVTDLQDQDVVEGYHFSLSTANQTRHYALSVARNTNAHDDVDPKYIAVVRDITEVTEQRRQLERFSKIARTTMNLVIVTDAHGCIEWVNPAFEARTGYQLSEIIGRKPGSFLQSPETDRKVVALIRQALAKLQPITCELLNVSKTGATYWVRMTIQPIFNEKGEHTGFMALQTDVTASRLQVREIQKAFSAEQAARMQLKSAVDNMTDALIMFDKDGLLVTCNEQYRALFPELGELLFERQEFKTLLTEGLRLGVFNTNSLSPDDWIEQQTRMFQLRHSQHRIRNLEGRWYREAHKPTPDGGRICVLSDITDLKDAEQRALADRARAMDASRDGIALVSPDGRVSYMNPAGVKIMQQSSATSMLGKNWLSLLLDADADAARPVVSRSITENGYWEGSAQVAVSPGQLLDIEISATLNADSSILCIFRDITDKRQSEIEREALREELTLARRREEIGHIAAGLTHDFNNLLSVITGAASLIQEEREIDSAKAMAGKILDASDQAAGLLRRMLSLGKSNPVREVIDLCRSVRDAEALVRTGLRAPIKLTSDLPSDPILTRADSTAIVQVVMNLIINARDALLSNPPQHGVSTIDLSVTRATAADLAETYEIGSVDALVQYACVTVRDSGPGMPKDVRDNIFTPYFSTKGAKGSGLGVPIVVGAVREHGGALSLQTEVGKGTCFKILWPIEPAVAGIGDTVQNPWADKAVLAYASAPEDLEQLTEQLEIAGAMVVPCATISDVDALLEDDDESWSAVILALGDLAALQAAERMIQGRSKNTAPIAIIADTALTAQMSAYPATCAGPINRDDLLDDLRHKLELVG